ncbi:MAG: TetR/AcrR family transcriptional regulator [Actinobacteria bacterium]|jgi:AcrR family transcriptional regulator|nr:TetR/AcrR family transcriptional regulator [Actinomycetota bacterium]
MKSGESGTGIRRNAQGQRAREEILDAASRVMSEYGYEGASISAIIKESGLQKSSIYWQFDSKAAIAAAVMERGARRFFDATGAIRVRGKAGTRLQAYLTYIADNIDEHEEFLRLFLTLLITNRDPDVAQVLDRVRSEANARMREFIAMAFEAEGPEVAGIIGDRLAGLGVALFDGYFLAAQIAGVDGRNQRVRDMAQALEHYGNAIASQQHSAAARRERR